MAKSRASGAKANETLEQKITRLKRETRQPGAIAVLREKARELKEAQAEQKRTSGAGLSANEKSIASKYNGQGIPGAVFDAYTITTRSGATVDILWKKGDGKALFLEAYKGGKPYLDRLNYKEDYRQIAQQHGRKPKI